ncbi:hypothetical protein OIO90_005460 [Microbotryomycetes sp. JL221]|nr:hypothetical protein OIO90_005460 [Microbotryomycetes sp. JL221]
MILGKHRPAHTVRKIVLAALVVLLIAKFQTRWTLSDTWTSLQQHGPHDVSSLSLFGGARSFKHGLQASSSVLNHRRDKDRLAIVLPFTSHDIEHELSNLEQWVELGAPTLDRDNHRIDLLWLYNKDDDDNVSSFINHSRFERAWNVLKRSFASYSVLYCDLTDEEDVYPAGPSNMFFKLFLKDELKDAIAPYMAVYWMEWDVFPIRPYWASQLLRQADTPEPFWQRGSIYLGRAFDDSVVQSYNWNWVSHINGNALYASDDQDWRDFLELVRDQEPPNHYWKPFDVSIAKVFRHLPYAWLWQQKFSGRFQYSDFVLHYGFTIQDVQVEDALKNPNTFLIHGKRSSAGKVQYDSKMGDEKARKDVQWGDEVTGSLRLSVLMRSWREDLDFALLAAISVKKHLWNALEIVVVMPSEDFSLFKTKKWPEGVKLVPEPNILPNGDIQQKLTKLRADMYCEGDYILHLDSDTVIARTVLQKDVVWIAGRPAHSYAPYDTLPEGVSIWREGTGIALGQPVEFEFSRNSFHVYPRKIYANARAHIERVHGMSLIDFLTTRIGRAKGQNAFTPEDRARMFSDFNYLGAYAYYIEPELLSWVPAWDEGRAHGTYPIIPPIICQGNARLALDRAKNTGNTAVVPYMKRLMLQAMNSGSCHELNEMMKKADFKDDD